MSASHSVETVVQIFNDDTGDHVDVGPDRDAGDNVEIRSYDKNDKIGERITFTPEVALLVAKAIINLYGAPE